MTQVVNRSAILFSYAFFLSFTNLVNDAQAIDTIFRIGPSGPDTGIHAEFGPQDINSSGDVVGTLIERSGKIRAYRYSSAKKSRTTLATPKGHHSAATGINSLGQVSGEVINIESGRSSAVAWSSRGSYSALAIPGEVEARATKINDHQLYVGEISSLGTSCGVNSQSCDSRGFQFGSGIYLPLPESLESILDLNSQDLIAGSLVRSGKERAMVLVPGLEPLELLGGSIYKNAPYSVAAAINSNGVVVGHVAPEGSSTLSSFLWNEGQIAHLGTLGDGATLARDLNDNLFVVGESELAVGGVRHAFLFTSERGLEDLNSYLPEFSPWELLTAKAINNRGEIVGRGLKYGRQADYFLRLVSATFTPDSDTAKKLKRRGGVSRQTELFFNTRLVDSRGDALAERAIRLERRIDSGAWTVIDEDLVTDEDGVVELAITPSRTASYRVVGPLDDEFLPPFDSASVFVRVKR